MAEGPRKFGRYFLLDLLAQGGMAEIYRARLASADGAGRLLVIKRIQAGYGQNAEFLSMFRSEIKVTMGFNHPNIVQLYDFGEEANQPYIAMEYVDGKNLRQFMSRFLELKQRFPIDLAVYLIEQAACGLHYAHSFKDKISGQPLNVVHRDISPQNLIISFEGTVKVIDFGIAKAATNSESTRAGVIKGKPSYLSPEQINGDVLDGRSDLFSLGTVLWELLAGRKLFAGDNDLAVLKLIESCQTYVKPPSTLNPNVPPELDYIVLKALAKQRDKRYQSAEEFQRALHKFLYASAPDFNPSDLSYYAKDLFKKEIVDDRKKIQKLNDEVELLIMKPNDEAIGSFSRAATSVEPQDRTRVAPTPQRAPSFTVLEPTGTETKVEVDQKNTGLAPPRYRSLSHSNPTQIATPPKRAATATLQSHAAKHRPEKVRTPAQTFQWVRNGAVAAVATLAMLSFFGEDMGIHVPYVTDFVPQALGLRETRVVLRGQMSGVKVSVNGQVVQTTSLPTTLKGITPDAPISIVVIGANGSKWNEIFTLKKGETREFAVVLSGERSIASGGETEPSSAQQSAQSASQQQQQQQQQTVPQQTAQIQAETPKESSRTILLRLNVHPGGGAAVLTLNGKHLSSDNPAAMVPLDTPLELTAERPGFKPYSSQFFIESRTVGTLREWTKDVAMEPNRFGTLTLKTTPTADAIIVLDDGKPWKKRTPFENERVPVGTYNIKLVNEVLGMGKTLTITVHEGQVIILDDVRLDIN